MLTEKTRVDYSAPGWDGPPVAVLWTQSLVWGLLCIETLSKLEIPFRLLSALQICEGCLDAFRILLVPGGWAAHKVRSLGEAGRLRIAGFIEQGGSYIGFCGGAGLALSSPPALNLTPIRRMPLSERLPSASGRIYVSGALSHPAWKDIPAQIPVSIWWPSQFQPNPGCPAECLASYTVPGDGFQVADLRACDVDEKAGWKELEKAYGINLDPARIKGQPAIIGIEKGKGRLVLSYAHLETPGDDWGNRLFSNILHYLNEISIVRNVCPQIVGLKSTALPAPRADLPSGISKAKQAAAGLIAFGETNLLWNWRKPWLLNWKRGIRGLEYGSLYVTLCYMSDLEQKLAVQSDSGVVPEGLGEEWSGSAEKLEEKTLEFCALAKRLLFEEKIAAGIGTVSKLGKVSEKVNYLRNVLFGATMNYGGLCGVLFDLIDRMLLELISLDRRAQY